MRAFRRRRFWITLRYRLGVLGICLAYVLAALEIPLPVFVHKEGSVPFPCQDHACGCQTAEQCWSHCCCFSPEERWAWARDHNVEPPAYAEKPVEKPADEGWNTVKLRDRDCDTTPEKNCCCASKPAAPVKDESDSSRKWITMMSAWRCQGYATLWTTTGTVLPVAPVPFSIDEAPPSQVCVISVQADLVPSCPPDPPPRLSLV